MMLDLLKGMLHQALLRRERRATDWARRALDERRRRDIGSPRAIRWQGSPRPGRR